jgi:ankyrin repeat protein
MIRSNPALVSAADAEGFTALHLAAAAGKNEIAEVLISCGADVNARERSFRQSPLIAALLMRQTGIVEVLVKHGADVNARDSKGMTPLHIAAGDGDAKSVKLLIENGAQVNVRFAGVRSPLRIAEDAGYSEVADLLRKHGAVE